MPNWCENVLYVTGAAAEAASLRSFMTTRRSKFDCHAIIPMPTEIEQSPMSSLSNNAWMLKYGNWRAVRQGHSPQYFVTREAAIHAARASDEWGPVHITSQDELLPFCQRHSFDELADAIQERIIKYGHVDEDSWACACWGTNRLASDAGWMSSSRAAKRNAHQVAYFQTAWSPPFPVVMSLSARFPNVILRLEYCEPGCGFRGYLSAQTGDVTAYRQEDYDWEADGVSLSHDLRHSGDGRKPVYVGPGRTADANGPAFPKSVWANPFATSDRTGAEAVDLHLRWLLGEAEVVALLPPEAHQRPSLKDIQEQLRGMALLCDCGRGKHACHGATLMRFATGWDCVYEDCDEDEQEGLAC